MDSLSALESLLKRDRWITLTGLIGVSGLAWVYLIIMAGNMVEIPMEMGNVLGLTEIKPWTLLDFGLMLLMWIIMMVAMMIPSAAPMILLFARVNRQAQEGGHPFIPVSTFVSGYFIAWIGFSLCAVLLQWILEQAALLSPMMVSTSPRLGGLILIAAGLYQWSSLKYTCLSHCRSPFEFINRHWRTGSLGALRMGIEHGAFCLGCCWVLMGLLFIGGVMNLLWIATITGFVLVEKILPFGPQVGKITGVGLILMGLIVISQS